MIEKIPGCALITKIRSILLMEADLNATNKEIFGIRMLDQVRGLGLIPEEIYSKRNRLADDGTLAKVIFYDIVRQTRRPAGIAAVDADNCYDRIAHPIASLIFQSMGVPLEAIKSMLTTIQEMKFFLRTGYGDSTDYAGSTGGKRTQGLCQGNGAAPAGWTVTTIPMIRAHKRKQHGVHLISPISRRKLHVVGSLYVDDTDLEHFTMQREEAVDEAQAAMQESIVNWGRLLVATGGALKPAKCFYHMISFLWDQEGRWKYDDNEEDEDMGIEVPLEDGSMAPIEHLPLDTPTKTLGSITCPTGSSAGSLAQMVEKATGWKDKAFAGKIHRRTTWFLLEKQFWPKVGFGLSCISATWAQLEDCLMKTYYDLMPIAGVRRSAPKELRQMSRGFYGIGFPHTGVECFAAQLTKLLSHYGSDSGVGLHLQTSMELMVIELGNSLQPLLADYLVYQGRVTHSWLKTLWEKAHMFRMQIVIAPLELPLPREHDAWIMDRFEAVGYSGKDLLRLNRVRCHQQVLFWSDVMDAGGAAIDTKYLVKRRREDKWSRLIFPLEEPPRRDFILWASALNEIANEGRWRRRLGTFLTKGHKVWEWKVDDVNILRHRGRDGIIRRYSERTGARATRRANTWQLDRRDSRQEFSGNICSVRASEGGGVTVVSRARFARTKQKALHFTEILKEWGNAWPWENLSWTGEDDWVVGSIREGTCVAVTDGSYMADLYPEISSAAVILECSQGKGRICCSFAEASRGACSYRGELCGLLAIHLLLLAVNKTNPGLRGSVHIHSDCLSALDKINSLPSSRIPTSWAHSDILKTIMLNCEKLSFNVHYSHVKAHQDDSVNFAELSRPSQLNCMMDYQAKKALWDLQPTELPRHRPLPCEAVSAFIGGNKITIDGMSELRFQVHKRLARDVYGKMGVLNGHAFDRVDWETVHQTLNEVPKLFQLWACKQVMGIAGTMEWDKSERRLCPSCMRERDTCEHVLHCHHEGRVETLHHTLSIMEEWMQEADTDPDLQECIAEYAHGRGALTMQEICWGRGELFLQMAQEQDEIGWRRFMEGMIGRRMREIQRLYRLRSGEGMASERWARGVVLKLLETTHGQWLYRNVQIHDAVAGTLATVRKEALMREIEEQREMGTDGLLEEDQWLLEINMGDLEEGSGEKEQYWLVAIKAAREAAILEGRQSRAQEAGQRAAGHVLNG